MKGDFSRIRFNPLKQYTAVLEQQGRVSLDADANEQQGIDSYLRHTTNLDVIGQFGGPIGDAGFGLEIFGNEIRIGRGRYYVNGLLVENEFAATYDNQPFLIAPTFSAEELLDAVLDGQGCAQFYLEVWQRLVTQLDDPCLREPALGQADTTARLQTVWRVVAELNPDNQSAGNQGGGEINFQPTGGETIFQQSGFANQLSSCCQSMYPSGEEFVEIGGMTSADTGGGGGDCGCQPIPSAGYQGLENQLYRIEIHVGGRLETATFKWSRENGSVVTQITAVNGATCTVTGIGPDANLGFQVGQWVELTDDTYLFGQPPNQPGSLYLISDVQCAAGRFLVTLSTQVTGLDPTQNARMRRWDQAGASATGTGIALSAIPVPIENGIEVTFREGQFNAGDYWTIPARTSTGTIDWPPCGGDGNPFQAGQNIEVYRAPLACVHQRAYRGYASEQTYEHTWGSDERFWIDDCRLLFPPLTALNANTVTAAIHVQATSWVNDDIIPLDQLISQGIFMTLDQAPTCPWSGGNFRVTVESATAIDAVLQNIPGLSGMTLPDGTDLLLRAAHILDPPAAITVSGTQVNWLSPGGVSSLPNILLFSLLNALLNQTKGADYARVRIRLDGGAVYAEGPNGNIYLDGQSFGTTATRAGDGSECIHLTVPSGAGSVMSDYEGWFYVTPIAFIASVAIQGTGPAYPKPVPVSAVKVLVNQENSVIGYQIGEQASATQIQALITLSFAPVQPAAIVLSFSGTGAGTIVTIQGSATVPAGQISVTVPINIPFNPGPGKNTVTLNASLTTALGNAPFANAPTLTISGTTPPPPPNQ